MKNHRSFFKTTLVALILLGIQLQASGGTPARAQKPDKVYVFNSSPPLLIPTPYLFIPVFDCDGFQNNSEGYSWSQLGLLDNNGKPGKIQALSFDILDDFGIKIGEVIREGSLPTGKIVGYRSLDGTKEAYNVSIGGFTTNQAWNRVKAGGELEIITHGGWRDTNKDGEVNAGDTFGGIRLDGRRLYGGFREMGTSGGGTNFRPPYEFDGRPGDNITLKLTTCWSSRESDNGEGFARSVSASALNVPGVIAAPGYEGMVTVPIFIELWGEFQKAMNALEAAAVCSGYTKDPRNDVCKWLSDLPFQLKYQLAKQIIDDKVGKDKTLIKLTYTTPYQQNSVTSLYFTECTDGHSHPQRIDSDGGIVSLGTRARLDFPSGAVLTTTIVHPKQIAILTGIPLPGDSLIAGIFDFMAPDEPVDLAVPAVLTIGYPPGTPTEGLNVIQFDDSVQSWSCLSGSIVDEVNYEVSVSVNKIGCYTLAYDGPQWNVSTVELFQDNFPNDGTSTGTVRADMAKDILPQTNPGIRPGDSVVVNVWACEGLAVNPYSGFGPAVYCYVSLRPPNQASKSGSALTQDSFRFPVVNSFVANGEQWYQIRMDTVFADIGRRNYQSNKFCVDLNDNLFTPSDTVSYFFSV